MALRMALDGREVAKKSLFTVFTATPKISLMAYGVFLYAIFLKNFKKLYALILMFELYVYDVFYYVAHCPKFFGEGSI